MASKGGYVVAEEEKGPESQGELAKVSGWGYCVDQGALITIGKTGKAWVKYKEPSFRNAEFGMPGESWR